MSQHPNSFAARKRNSYIGRLALAKTNVAQIAEDIGMKDYEMIKVILHNITVLQSLVLRKIPNPLPTKAEIKEIKLEQEEHGLNNQL